MIITLIIPSCIPAIPVPIELRFSFVNLSQDFYATLRIREHVANGEPNDYMQTDLLPPGATVREEFLTFTGTGCPQSLDVQLLLYKRINDDMPIGLDPGEEVEQTPIVAGEILDIPACDTANVFYTIVNWDAPEGTARVKFAQDTEIDTEIRNRMIFTEPDAAWEITGIDDALADLAPPPLTEFETVNGNVTLADGTPVPNIAVVIKTFFRTRLTDNDESNDPDSGFSEPIAFTATDDNGLFTIDRPPGAYQVEFSSDDFAFRPDSVFVESPIETITIIADPL